MNAINDVCNSIINNSSLLEWSHNESEDLKAFGLKSVGKEINFETLKGLRTCVKGRTKLCKEILFNANDNLPLDHAHISL